MKKVTLSLLVSLALLSSCTSSVKIALNESQWPQKKEYAVVNQKPLFKQQTLAFGDYKTQEVKRSWTKGTKSSSGFSMGGASIYVDHLTKKQTFRFKLQDGSQTSEAYCATNIKARDLVLGNAHSGFNQVLDLLSIGIETDNQFYAKIIPEANAQPWELFFDNRAAQRSKTYAGSLLQSPDNYYTIVSINKLQGKNGPVALPFGAVGFEFRNMQGQPVAAISIIDKGIVYLNDVSPAEKFLLANACAALLLQANDIGI
ncbi:hypothetical protein I5M27_10815 [Adhaeribacter sp. BT258]|uniref:Lipoprotein n=1 Tax=Adhaeribacter terrigena TaxID=2793070 RepID=A0ABS1C2D6_9BACT|nr:hypothetical protein [Adhaeribacter terrigena]MBK0403478.1 hypothetical protein [Adhaeribacter terrigena]